MRSLAGTIGLALALGLASAGDLGAQSNEGSIRADQVHEKAIRALYAEFTEAWNRHDVEAMTLMWAIDGDHVEPDGAQADGRDQIRRLLTEQHGGVFKGSQLSLALRDVWFVTGDVALVDGGYTLSGIRLPDGRDIPPRRGLLTSLLLHERGKWWIAASRLMVPTTLPYKSAEEAKTP